MVARIAMTTMTTRSSTMVKEGEEDNDFDLFDLILLENNL
jgi:hypothetical protein